MWHSVLKTYQRASWSKNSVQVDSNKSQIKIKIKHQVIRAKASCILFIDFINIIVLSPVSCFPEIQLSPGWSNCVTLGLFEKEALIVS